MTLAEANTLVDLLLEAHQRSTMSWGVRVLEYGRAERSGQPDRIAHALAELYAETELKPPQELMVRRLEERLLPELAAALGESEAEVRAKVHGRRPIFAGDAPPLDVAPSLPAIAAPAGWEAVHQFQVGGGALAVGSSPEDDEHSLLLIARDGTWLVFTVTPPRSWLGALFGQKPPALVAVHSDLMAQAARRLASAVAIESTEGRHTSLVDGAARRDPRVRSLIDHGELSARSYTFMSESDRHAWRGVRDDGKFVLIATDVGDGD